VRLGLYFLELMLRWVTWRMFWRHDSLTKNQNPYHTSTIWLCFGLHDVFPKKPLNFCHGRH